MLLLLMRHGHAEHGRPGAPDQDRALTPEGRAQLQRQAAAMRLAGLTPHVILTSPYRRAQETAAILGETLEQAPQVAPALGCGCRLEDLAAAVEAAGQDAVLAVGHQPDLGAMIHALTGARAAVTPGTLAVIEARRLRPEGGTLLGLYDPDVLARLGVR